MRVSHESTAVFDEANLVSCAGLAPVLTLAERAWLHELLAEHLTLSGPGAANAPVKVTSLVAGMIAGADSIDDMDVLRHGAMSRLFDGVRAPSTLGTFLRTSTFGHVRQLDAVAARLLTQLARQTPLLTGADQVTYLDIDDTVKRTYGYAKQGAGYGYSGVKGLNALLATVSTPLAAPVIAGSRLRKGGTNSARGASRLLADALVTAKTSGARGLLVVRADSAFYNHDVLATAVRHGARFSVTARQDPNVRKSIEAIGDSDTAWTPIHYPNAIWDEAEQRLISDAEVAEITHTAFSTRRHSEHITGRLIVRRVRRLNTVSRDGAEQDELLPAWRYHAVFTNSPLRMLAAEAAHRGHAIIEQVIAELKDGPLAHLPSGKFTANAAWLVMATIAFNLTRAAGTLASRFHARARLATLRTHLINVPARIARSARCVTLHLPTGWPWRSAWQQLDQRTRGTPTAVTPLPPPTRPDKEQDHVENPERPGGHPRPSADPRSTSSRRALLKAGRWIQAQRRLVALVSVLASLRLTSPAKPSSPSRPHRPVLSDGAVLLSAAAAGWLIWCGVVTGALAARATAVVPPVSAAVKARTVRVLRITVSLGRAGQMGRVVRRSDAA